MHYASYKASSDSCYPSPPGNACEIVSQVAEFRLKTVILEVVTPSPDDSCDGLQQTPATLGAGGRGYTSRMKQCHNSFFLNIYSLDQQDSPIQDFFSSFFFFLSNGKYALRKLLNKLPLTLKSAKILRSESAAVRAAVSH